MYGIWGRPNIQGDLPSYSTFFLQILTLEQVAARLQIGGCDITRSAVAKIEVGQRHLYPDEIILLKRILNVEYDEIFDIDV